MIRCPDWSDPEKIFRFASHQNDRSAVPNLAEVPGKGSHSNEGAIAARKQPGYNAAKRSGLAEGSEAGECTRHKIKAGDTLGAIANRYLGSPARFPEIAAANPEATANPGNLKLGDVLTIPCGNAAAGNSRRVKDPGGASRNGLLSWLFGKDRKDPVESQEEPQSTPPTSAAVPVWNASKGEFLIDVLDRWGQKAGYQVVIEDHGDWQFDVEFSFEGTFQLALKEVAKGFGSGAHAPLLVVYANKVIRVGTAQ